LGDEKLVQTILDDFRTAPIDEKLRAALSFLEKMCLRPDELGAADAEALQKAGVSPEAAADVAYVGYLFCVYTRMADTLSFAIPPSWKFTQFFLLKIGYR
jgi:alkylhydroperoxidase family enzyme